MLNKTAFAEKGNGVRIAVSGGISDSTLMSVATGFRNSVTRKFRVLAARLLEQTFSAISSLVVTLKVDGEGVFVYFDAELDLCVAFNAPSGKTRVGLPCTEALKRHLRARGHKRCLAQAELYLKADSRRTRVSDVIHTAASGDDEARSRLALAFYDVVMLDGKDLRDQQRCYDRTWTLLGDLFGTDQEALFHRVEGQIIPGSEIRGWFDGVVSRGLEGCVVRVPGNDAAYKIKPSLSIDATVVGYVEDDYAGGGRYGVMSLLCALSEGSTLVALCRVGSGFTDEQREQLLQRLAPLRIEAPLRMTDSDGRPVTFVAPDSLVVEVEGESLHEAALDGTPIVNQTFSWLPGVGLRFTGIAASPKLTHATFAQVREDKIWNEDGGTRLAQVMTDIAIAKLLRRGHDDDEQQGEEGGAVLLREVYIRSGKAPGGEDTAVRRLIVVDHGSDPRFTRYAVHWTDYSAGRQDPYKTEVRTARTRDRLEALITSYRAEGAKKGWALANAYASSALTPAKQSPAEQPQATAKAA